jgi:SAM-dependent methyltransferase
LTADDNFGRQADKYARYRPRYPDELFEYLAGLCPGRDLAWDCATGSGQAAISLARHFGRVMATDISARQIAQAAPHPGVTYQVNPAHVSGLPDVSADLVTVATALHWLELESFYSEVSRVTKPGGVLAAWCYLDAVVAPAIDPVLIRYRREVVGADWAFEVCLVFDHYRTMPFPFAELTPPGDFVARARWSLEDALGYLDSWSATQRYRDRTGEDPRSIILPDLAAGWGDPAEVREVTWPLFMRVGRVNT